MTANKTPPPDRPQRPVQTEKEKRLADALRKNLRRRKAAESPDKSP